MVSKSPAVACTSCARTWNSASMVEGLKLMGSCPRCGGALEFGGDGTAPHAVEATRTGVPGQAPHLVLGIPRR
jgi:hypothetical protein